MSNYIGLLHRFLMYECFYVVINIEQRVKQGRNLFYRFRWHPAALKFKLISCDIL